MPITKVRSGRVILTQGYKRGDKPKYVKLLPPYEDPELKDEVRYTTTTNIEEATVFPDAEQWCKDNLWKRHIPHITDCPVDNGE